MSISNIKLSSDEIRDLKKYTKEKTGQKAVQKAILYFLKEARQRRISKVLESIKFDRHFDPIKLRRHER